MAYKANDINAYEQGQRLRIMRKARGLTQGDLADALNISRTAISHYESGEYNPDIETYYKLAEILKCDVLDIMCDESAAIVSKLRSRGEASLSLIEYQRAAQRTANPRLAAKDKLINGAMGLCGESGEVIDIVKKHLWQGHDLDIIKIIDELGDVMWYVAEAAAAVGSSIEEVARYNIKKLQNRYPAGFSADDSIHREGYNA